MAEIPDGVYEVVNETMNVLSLTNRPRDQIERLAKILKDAQESRAPASEVAKQIKKQAPEFAEVAKRLLVPKDASAFYALLAVIVMILFQVLATPGGVTDAELAHIMSHAQLPPPTRQVAPSAPVHQLQPRPPRSLEHGTPTRSAPQKKRSQKKRPPKTYGQQKRKKRRR